MKKTSFLWMLVMIVLSLCLTSCFNNGDWPKTVKFPRQGGTKIVSGDVAYAFSIEDWNGNILDSEAWHKDSLENTPDTVKLAYEWLTVIVNPQGNEMTLIADPEKRNKEHYQIRFMVMNEACELTVSMH